MKVVKHLSSLTLPLLLAACGGGSGASLVNLSSLPSASGLVASSSSSTGMGFGAVIGTPPIVGDLELSDFYGTLFTRMSAGDANLACNLEAQEMFGGRSGGVGGDTACWMSQTVAQAVSNLTQNGGSICYMKNMPAAESGVTITPDLSDRLSLFNRQSDDRIVRVNVSQPEGEGGGGDMTVFIKVYGSSNADVGTSKYKVDLWFCAGETPTATGIESFTVDTAAKTFSATGLNSEGGGSFSFEMNSAIVVGDDGAVSFDASQSRSAEVSFVGTGFSHKSSISITGDDIITSKERGTGDWGSHDNFTQAEIAGGGISTLRFLQGAIRGYSTPNCMGCSPHTFSGATEWQTDVYRYVASSSLLTGIPSDFRTSDSFFDSEPSVDTSSLASLSCTVTPDFTVTMDFADPAVAAIQTECESERFEWTDKCNSAEVQTARNKVFTAYGSGFDATCGSD
jgi:hypothetical protein